MCLGEIVSYSPVYERGADIEWATGAALAIASRARQRVGQWDESFFLYSEEVDYLARIRREGLSVRYVPSATVVHRGGDYQTNPDLSRLMTTNRIRYFARSHGRVATALFRMSIMFGEFIRIGLNPGHRAAFRAAVGHRS
jgi:GT2 family glycosyltransferase